MKQSVSLKNRNYLALTSIISVGVLSGNEYCSPLLAVLLIAPVVKLLIKNVMSEHTPNLNTRAMRMNCETKSPAKNS